MKSVPKHPGWLIMLAILAVSGCTSGGRQVTPHPTTETTPSPSTSPSASSPATPATPASPTKAPGPTGSPTPTGPVLADFPPEGRNLESCGDGRCRVVVRNGDRVPMPSRSGFTEIVIASITSAEVTIHGPHPGGGTGTYTFFAGPDPIGLSSSDRLIVAFLNLQYGQAIMQVDV